MATLQNFYQELPSLAGEQHIQLESQLQALSTDSESEAEEQQRVRTVMATASEEVANISKQCTALLKEAVFNTVPSTVNVKRGVATQTPSTSSEEEKEANLLKDIVDHLLTVPGKPVSGTHCIWFKEPLTKTSIHTVRVKVPPEIEVPYIKGSLE